MTPCQCTRVKQILNCGLSSAPGECLSASQMTTQAGPLARHSEPPALNSDALTSSLSAILGGAATQTNEL